MPRGRPKKTVPDEIQTLVTDPGPQEALGVMQLQSVYLREMVDFGFGFIRTLTLGTNVSSLTYDKMLPGFVHLKTMANGECYIPTSLLIYMRPVQQP